MMKMKKENLLLGLMVALVLVSVASSIYSVSGLRDLQNKYTALERKLSVMGESYYPLLVKDALGRVVMVSSEPMRIVSGAPSITEILFAIGAGEKIVGVDEYSDYPEELLTLKENGKIATVGGVTTLNPEKVAALRPDLVLVDASLQSKFVPTLEELGLTVIAVESKSVEDILKNIQLISKVTSKLEEGRKVIGNVRSAMQEVYQRVSSLPPTRVLYLCWPEPMWAVGKDTYADDLIRTAGGEGVFSNRSGWFVVNPEEVVSANPNVIVMSSMALRKSPEELFSYLKSLPGFEQLDAIKDNRVYILTGQAANLLERAGPRVADAVFLLACIFHPEVFHVSLPNFINEYTGYVKEARCG